MLPAVLLLLCCGAAVLGDRSFSIDYANNQFLMNGQPYRYISGSVHYFRTHPDQWEARLKTARALGLNAIQTYIPWNFHETYRRQYDFTGWRNITAFFELAAKYDLAVIVRPGPYICAEWENGGLPYWLLNYPDIKLRSSEQNYLTEALSWFDAVLSVVKPSMWNNGGNVIMVQIENEYGAHGCDKKYLGALRDNAYKNLGNDAVLFTTDPPEVIECGHVENVYATVDFGERGEILIGEYAKIQHKMNPNGGPSVNSEYYPGWYQTWGEKAPYEDFGPREVASMTELLYNHNFSFNYYMIHGGTNFGFWNGAEPPAGLITSYDYHAPMTENGDTNEKFDRIQKFIKSISNWPNPPQTQEKPKTTSIAKVPVSKYGNIFDYKELVNMSHCLVADQPFTFEYLDQPSGFVLYFTTLQNGGKQLNASSVKDFGYVFTNGAYKGTLAPNYKPKPSSVLSTTMSAGDNLTILVESQSRQTYQTKIDHKGIVGPIQLDSNTLSTWTSCPVDIENLGTKIQKRSQGNFMVGDVFYGEFTSSVIADTFLDLSNWGKGVVWVNGFNLGRYWASAGPQKYLFVPAPVLKSQNYITILELEKLSSDCQDNAKYCTIDFKDKPISLK